MTMDDLNELLDEIEEYLDDHSDAEYGPDGVPRGNKAMRLLGELQRSRQQIKVAW